MTQQTEALMECFVLKFSLHMIFHSSGLLHGGKNRKVREFPSCELRTQNSWQFLLCDISCLCQQNKLTKTLIYFVTVVVLKLIWCKCSTGFTKVAGFNHVVAKKISVPDWIRKLGVDVSWRRKIGVPGRRPLVAGWNIPSLF